MNTSRKYNAYFYFFFSFAAFFFGKACLRCTA